MRLKSLCRVIAVLALLCGAVIGRAQGTPAAGSGAGAASEASQSQQQTPSASTYTLRTTVREVTVDVVVTDAKGRVVKGLKSSDFRVLEDKVAQPCAALRSATARMPRRRRR